MFKKQKRINGFLLPGVLPLVPHYMRSSISPSAPSVEPSSRRRRRNRPSRSGSTFPECAEFAQLDRRLPPRLRVRDGQRLAHPLDLRLGQAPAPRGRSAAAAELSGAAASSPAARTRPRPAQPPGSSPPAGCRGRRSRAAPPPACGPGREQVQVELLAEHLDNRPARQEDADQRLAGIDHRPELLQLLRRGLTPERLLDHLPARLHEPALPRPGTRAGSPAEPRPAL